MKTLDLELACADGVRLPATAFEDDAPRAVAVIAPAMGVPRRFYRAFAGFLASNGVAALSFDVRGIGEAAKALPDPGAARMQDWGALDLDAALAEAGRRWPAVPVVLVGHSAGAQLWGLTPRCESIAAFVFAAGPRPHVSQDRGAYRLMSALWWYVLVPLFARGAWFPAKRLGFAGVDVPAGVAAEWGRWARSRKYLFDPRHRIDIARYARATQPVLAWSFADDNYCPKQSTDELLQEMPKLTVTRRHLRPSDIGAKAVGHMGFFREKFREALWAPTLEWIRTTLKVHA